MLVIHTYYQHRIRITNVFCRHVPYKLIFKIYSQVILYNGQKVFGTIEILEVHNIMNVI